MAKSNLQLLQEALAAGDVEKAKALTEKLMKAGKLKTTKANIAVVREPKAKAKAKAKPRPTFDDESSYIAPARPYLKDGAGRTFTDAQGNVHTFARRVSMKGTKFKNKFEPNEYDALPDRHAKVDKSYKKKKPVVRRPAAEKVKARCFACGKMYSCYAWECEKIDSKTQYRCNDCIKVR